MVTERDRAHFRVIAEAKALEKQEQIERAARDDTANGILEGLALAHLSSTTPEIQALEDRRADEQVELRRAWLRLQSRR